MAAISVEDKLATLVNCSPRTGADNYGSSLVGV